MKTNTDYKVNNNALNNGKQTIYSEGITLLNYEFEEVALDNILDVASQAQGCMVYVHQDGDSSDFTTYPENKVHVIGEDVFVETESINYHINPKFDFPAFSDTNKITEIEKSAANSNYVTSTEIFAKGESTVVFCKPNDDKTLITLAAVTQNISSGGTNGEDVFYFNLGDTKSSYLEKLKILKRFEVNVFNVNPTPIMTHLIDKQHAKGRVVIIDTLINACDFNNHQKVMQFSELIRSFCELGGTVITLADAKKYVDRDGVPILDGIELIKENAHCVYYLKRFDDIIKMINIQKRAKVKAEVTFQVGMGLPYPDLFNSVRMLSDKQAAELFNDIKLDQFAIDHECIIEAIKETILNGINQRTALVKAVYELTGNHKYEICDALDMFEGKLWRMTRGRYNSKVYSLI